MADADPFVGTPGMRVAERIKTAILNGRFVAGQRLVELDLTREFETSRAHVREALRQLRAEGLVDIEANRGAMVKRISRADVYAAGRVREALEGLASRQLAERPLSDERRAALVDLRARLTRTAQDRDFDGYIAANEDLHSFIVRECGNPYLIDFLERLRLLVRQTQQFSAYRTEQLFDGNIEHQAIIDAILLANPEVAETMMRMHVRKGTKMIDDWLSGSASSAG